MVASGLRGLAALGLEIPADPSKEMLDKAVAEVNELLGERPISDLLHSPPATDERAKACSPPPVGM
jgi:predicted ATPase